MVEKWKLALKELLSNYENNEDVVGAVLCGSYATGNNNDNSDIDVYLVLKNSCNYQSSNKDQWLQMKHKLFHHGDCLK